MPESARSPVLGAPQLRDAGSVAAAMRTVVIALVPCILVGVWNTGRQASAALASLGPESSPGWRVEWLSAAGLDLAAQEAAGSWALGALYLLPLLLVAAAAALFWEQLFARLRQRPVGEGALVTALIFTLLLPPAAPLWQAFLGLSFGIVVGKLLFGGIGRNFLNPAITGLAFLAVAHPEEMPGSALFPGLRGHHGTEAFARAAEAGAGAVWTGGLDWSAAFVGLVEPARLGESSLIACLLGAAWLIHRRVASWRVMAGVALGALGAAASFNLLRDPASPEALPAAAHLVLGGLGFVAVFVATDPVSTGSTRASRWLAGLSIGALAVVLRLAHPEHPDGVVSAVLLVNVATPLIDHAVVRAGSWRRAGRARRAERASQGLVSHG